METVEISKAERNLVDKLKLLCDEKGKEIDPIKSVPIFHDLAEIYGRKTKQKKVNAIRSAAFLRKAKAKIQNANLVKISANLQRKLKQTRKKMGAQYNKVTRIPDNVKENRLVELQRKIILDVKNIQKKVTKQYTELMRFVSDECIEIMGNPPCKYSVVGLGSLARSEITLYSDFEHIILLDDEAACNKERDTIMRYFKWFSTIFHIVLINLGETMIPSVAIPSLNSENCNWFYDAHTPNGVTFDGMMSHASKIPLGRQPTVNKPWKMELIKPVNEMLQLLEKEEDIKQGYHFSDILSKSCFVAGDKTLFCEYQDKSHEVVKKKDKASNFSMVIQQLDEDLQNLHILNLKVTVFAGFQNFNIKRVIYRSSTIFIASIGRRCSFKVSSCFDIINMLEQCKVCSKMVGHKLRFMVAVACQVRFKVYHSRGRQDDIFMEDSDPNTVVSGVFKVVGKQSLCSFMETVVSLHGLLQSALYQTFSLNFSIIHTVECMYNSKLVAMWYLGLNEDMKMEIRKSIKFPSVLQQVGIIPFLNALFALTEIHEYSLGNDLCEQMFQLCKTNLQEFIVSVVAFNCKLKLGRYDERDIQTKIEDLNKLVVSCKNEMLPNDRMIFSVTLSKYGMCLYLVNQKDQANIMMEQSLQYCNEYLETPEGRYDSPVLKAISLYCYSHSLLKIKHFNKAFHIIQECLVILTEYKQATKLHKEIFHMLSYCYTAFEQYFESFICLCEVVRILNDINEPVHHELKQDVLKLFNYLSKK